jgi:hypothetical protein
MIQQVTSIKTSANGTVFYTAVLDDGENFRSSVFPGQNVDGHPSEVVDVCLKTWTPEVISAFKASVNAHQEL